MQVAHKHDEWLAAGPGDHPLLRLGVLGGTFDPIHVGHLVAAEAVRCHFQLDRILFVPAGQPPHKDPSAVTPAEHRYRMTVLATAGNPHFFASRMELDRPGPSYTIDTLRQLGSLAPKARLFFIAGVDAALALPHWRGGLSLLEAAELIVVTRAGTSPGSLEAFLHGLPAAYRQRVHPLAIPEIGISSSDLRDRVASGRSIRYLVPPAVEDYIYKHGLYRRREPSPAGAEPGTGLP